SVFTTHIFQPVVSIRVIVLICWVLKPFRFVCSRGVDKALNDTARLQFVFILTGPLLHLQLDQSTLVQFWATFKHVQELQQVIIHFIDFSSDLLTLPGQVEHEGDVVIGSDHEGIRVHGLSSREELYCPVVLHSAIVGLTLLQGAVHEHSSH
ncbi:putative gamma-glutamylaminecyclotransferase B-like, partial [Triplophysa rosa]